MPEEAADYALSRFSFIRKESMRLSAQVIAVGHLQLSFRTTVAGLQRGSAAVVAGRTRTKNMKFVRCTALMVQSFERNLRFLGRGHSLKPNWKSFLNELSILLF